MSEPTKTITATQLTDALSQHFIDANMGMPGPRQERMAADIWFRLPVAEAATPAAEPGLDVERLARAVDHADIPIDFGAFYTSKEAAEAIAAEYARLSSTEEPKE